jgi:hypothetical protein
MASDVGCTHSGGLDESNSRHRSSATKTVLGMKLKTTGVAASATPTTASGIAQRRWLVRGALTAGAGSGTISSCVSITEVTTAAGWIAGLAIVALIAAGWRKPARATADPARARRPFSAPAGVEVKEIKTPMARRSPWWRRLWSIVAGSVLAVWVGAVLATIIGIGTAALVITLTNMLKR